MKKIYKLLVFVMMLALAVGSVVAAPITLFAATTALVGATLVLTKMPTTGTVNQEITIPKGTTTTSGSNVSVKVTDPLGKNVTLTEDGSNYKFTATMAGEYKATYTASAVANSNSETKEVFTIKVTGSSISMNFPTNSAFMLPSKVGKDTTIVLPYPTVSVNDEELSGVESSISLTVRDPKHQVWDTETTIQNYSKPLETKQVDGKSYFTFKPTKYNGETVYGTYSLTYKYRNSETGEISTKSFKISVSENYSVENQNVTFTWNGSLPESAVLGREVTLPTPVTVDANNNNSSVETYTKVLVKYYNGETTVDYTDKVKDFKFTPMNEAKSGSYYSITYQIYTLEQLDLSSYSSLNDALIANESKALTKTYKLANVTDTVAPVPQVVEAYSVELDGSLTEEVVASLKDADVSYLIPTKARTHVEVEIPAIYATDNYSSFEDLTLVRTLIDENGKSTNLDGSQTYNEDDDSLLPKIVQAKANETAKILFRKTGTYTIRYRATDKANNTKDASYKIVVTDMEDKLAPSITLPSVVQNTKPGETITFSPATVVDYKTDSSSAEVVDSNVKKDVYYFYGEASDATDFDALLENGDLKTENLSYDSSSSKYSLTVAENPSSSYLTIAFRAEDDGKYLGNQNEEQTAFVNNVGWAYKVVRIFSVNDSVVPTLETDLSTLANSFVSGGENVYGQGDTVNLTGISFKDKDDNNADTTEYLTATLKVLDKNGNQIKVSGVQYTYDNAKFTLSNGKFVTTVAGTYQIVVTVTDLGGNSLVNSIEFNVNDTKAPVVEVESFETSMELGKTYVLPTPVVVDDGEVVQNTSSTLVEFGESNPSYKFNQGTMEFTPLEKGNYTFRFLGVDSSNNPAASDWYTVSVSDTIKPVIVINETDEYTMPETAQYKDANYQVVNVKLPLFTATDEYNGVASTSVSVTDPTGDEISVTTEADHYEFTPNSNGIYTVTYTAVDLAGNSTTQTYSVKVGDVTAPTILVDETNRPTSYKVGETLSINFEKLSIKDDVDGDYEGEEAIDDGKLTITLTLPDGSTQKVTQTSGDDVWTYTFQTAGEYTLTYTATDEAGNSDDVVYNFKVESTSSSSTVSETTWGIVLIVVSVALLAGVVVYFVKTKDAPDAKDKKKED